MDFSCSLSIDFELLQAASSGEIIYDKKNDYDYIERSVNGRESYYQQER